MPLRILLIEDDPDLRRTLHDALRMEGHTVLPSASLADARARWRLATAPSRPAGAVGAAGPTSPPIDLVLLDLGLPDGDGEQLQAELRRALGPPVIVISAREAEGQKIRLLDAGADDYLVKPFGIGELLARIRVALRHRGRHAAPARHQHRHGGLEIDLDQRRVRRDGQDVRLTPTEYKLLARLVREAGRVVTHRQLLADVWGAEHTEQTHYLRLYMAQLRAKLEADPADPRHLLTELGVGYRLAEARHPDDEAGHTGP